LFDVDFRRRGGLGNGKSYRGFGGGGAGEGVEALDLEDGRDVCGEGWGHVPFSSEVLEVPLGHVVELIGRLLDCVYYIGCGVMYGLERICVWDRWSNRCFTMVMYIYSHTYRLLLWCSCAPRRHRLHCCSEHDISGGACLGGMIFLSSASQIVVSSSQHLHVVSMNMAPLRLTMCEDDRVATLQRGSRKDVSESLM